MTKSFCEHAEQLAAGTVTQGYSSTFKKIKLKRQGNN